MKTYVLYVTLHFRDLRSAAQRSAAQRRVALQKRAEITVLMGEQNPIRYGFLAGAKAIRHRVNTFPM